MWGLLRGRNRGLAAVVALALVAGATTWLRLDNGAAATTTLDKIIYSQQNGKNGEYLQYVPGDGSRVTTQPVTGAGGCATPNTTNPVLAFSAKYYGSGYGGPSTAAIVGAYNNRTGVCQIPQAWSIEVNEGLVFAPGSTNALTAGRAFSRAQLQLEREDKSTASDPPAVVNIVLRLGSTVVATQSYNLQGPNGTQTATDTGTSYLFDSLEIQVLSPAAGSISVVGPTSTFTLANQLCVGQSISQTSTDGTATSGQVTATFNYVGNSVNSGQCKAYGTFAATTTDPNSPTGKLVTLIAANATGAHLTATFDWGLFPYCQPGTSNPNVPTCPPTLVDFGSGFQVQTFCAAANPPATAPWCTTSQKFEYVTVNGTTFTHITETWDGLGDIKYNH
jgi:hypothetical protein